MLEIDRPNIVDKSVIATIDRYKEHRSLIRIKQTTKSNQFSFCKFDTTEVWDEVSHLGSTKSVSGNIPVKTLKSTSNFLL